MKSFVKKNSTVILSLLALLQVGAMFILYGLKSNSDFAYNFGLNFFTEMLGVAITVLIIERLIELSKEHDLLPLIAIQYEGIRLIISRFLTFWMKAYELGVPDAPPSDIRSFVSKEVFEKIFEHLYLKNNAPVTPTQDWGEYASSNAIEWKNLGNKIINQSNTGLEPKIAHALHLFIESPFINTLKGISKIRDFDKSNGFVRPQLFNCHTVIPGDEVLSALHELISWCEITYPLLEKKLPHVGHKQIVRFFIDPKRTLPPLAMANPAVIKNEADHSGLGNPVGIIAP